MGNNGNRLYVDITFGDPRGPSNVSQACSQPGYTISKLTYVQNRRYKLQCDQLGVSFLPAAMEIFGNTAPPVLELIKSLSARASEISFIPHATLYSYWLKRFSTTIQMGNARFLLDSANRMTTRHRSTFPATPGPTNALLEDIHISPHSTSRVIP